MKLHPGDFSLADFVREQTFDKYPETAYLGPEKYRHAPQPDIKYRCTYEGFSVVVIARSAGEGREYVYVWDVPDTPAWREPDWIPSGALHYFGTTSSAGSIEAAQSLVKETALELLRKRINEKAATRHAIGERCSYCKRRIDHAQSICGGCGAPA